MTLNAALLVVALALALAMRPWRAVAHSGPPWPWLAWWAVLPLFWAADRIAAAPIVQPLSGASLLVLLAGWPLAVLALLPVAGVTMLMGGLAFDEALHRLVWLGLVPATLALGLGALLRRYLPHHPFVYTLGRGFFGTVLCVFAAKLLAQWAGHTLPNIGSELSWVALWLMAWGDAFVTGMMTAIFVAYRPQWLATWSDTLYLTKS